MRVNNIHPHDALDQPFVPIGQPYGNDEVRYHLIEGRLYIQSPYLTPGYLNPEDNDTAFKYITDADGKDIRLFDTGDAFDEHEGFLRYQGRASIDSHCKINGVKVTPFYMEQCIQDYNQELGTGLIHAVVVIKEYFGQKKPFAYLVIPHHFNQDDFLTYLKSRLKKEEFPLLIHIDTLPRLVPSQKIDRQQLINRHDKPDDFLLSADKAASASLLEDDMVLAVKKIWADLFARDNIPIDAEFIVLGGDSLMALRMVKKINEQLDPQYKYITLLNLPTTIQQVAQSIAKSKEPASDALIKPLLRIRADKKNLFFLPALLGEGYFSYRHLAQRIANKFDKNIYGLSDPGITDTA